MMGLRSISFPYEIMLKIDVEHADQLQNNDYERCLTQRALDGWDSARFLSLF